LTAPYPPPIPAAGAQPNNTFGLVALIVGIVSIPLGCCFFLGIPVGIVAGVFGYLGKQKAEQGLATNRGQAVAGLICGGVGVVIGVLAVIATTLLNMNLPG